MLVALLVSCSLAAPEPLRVGSKAFTESVVLGELAAQLLTSRGAAARHTRELGGTAILWQALLHGEIDVYPEYTGTLRKELLAAEQLGDDQALAVALRARGIGMTSPLGFDNTYALGMSQARAEHAGITRISDLAARPELRFGLSNELMRREDGWPGLKARYGLAPQSVRGLQQSLAYHGLASGMLDVVDLYSTDAEIEHYQLRVLVDDQGYFPEYKAVYLYRLPLADTAPRAVAALNELGGRIDAAAMRRMNTQARIARIPEASVAQRFLAATLGAAPAAPPVREVEGLLARSWRHVLDHLLLVGLSLGAAVAVALPLGVLAAAAPRLGQALLALSGIAQTIPSLAALVFMIPLLGIGRAPALAALFFYSLLPIVQNTFVGLRHIPLPLRESAQALGLSPSARLWRIDLPLASPMILAGIKTAAVVNVGTATLGALIGAGGLGEPILTGIRLNDVTLVLEGAVPAALLALATQASFAGLERLLIPAGLRRRQP